jgi:soluble lytic murein transglycosylase-like protein
VILLSVGFGFGYDAVATAIERHRHPIPERYGLLIEQQAKEFGVPAPIIYAIVNSESKFVSNTVSEEDEIGLMQISPDLLAYVCTEILHEPVPDAGILYDPKTNLRIGTAHLAHLYEAYGVWDIAYAAWHAGEKTVDGWLIDQTYLDKDGQLKNIPDKSTEKFVSRVEKQAEMYTKLYF